jgi:sugar/nucleoside kinase (ribokinase family)
MSTHDLVLVGNITVDHVYAIRGWPRGGTSNLFTKYAVSIGGLGNIVAALAGSNLAMLVLATIGKDDDGRLISAYLKHHGIDAALHVSHERTTRALILSDEKENERTSFVDWGCGVDALDTVNAGSARWTHVSYLDVVPRVCLDKLRASTEVLSADLCLSTLPEEKRSTLLRQMHLLDYLFISLSEVTAYAENDVQEADQIARMLQKRHGTTIICHGRSDTILAARDGVTRVPNAHGLVDGINVLGAGDAYCANFIRHCLAFGHDIAAAAAAAHQEAGAFLLRRHREKI